MVKTPPLTSDYTIHRDTRDGIDVLVCTVGKTVLLYDARCLDDLHAMPVEHGDWMERGSADEQKPAKDGTVKAWARSAKNPIGGWYGHKKGLRWRFGMYMPRSWSTSAAPRSNTTRAATGCGHLTVSRFLAFTCVGALGTRSYGYRVPHLASWAIWRTGSRHDFAFDLPPVITCPRSRL